jgi:Raf kinase inhibitor-like YbhB/YbcL family protein
MKTLVSMAILFCIGLTATAADFKLNSPDVASKSTIGNKQVFNGFGCSGENVSPALNWSGAPAGTQSFALTIYDPDAPTGSGWWHWVVINIPANISGLKAAAGTSDGKSLPAGSQQVRTDFGAAAYGGPCPPAGDKPHRYIFTLYALKVPKIEVSADATAALAGFMINANKLQSTTFTAYYGR